MTLHDDSPRGRVRLSRTRAVEELGHLWIYAGYVEEVSGELVSGDVVDVMAPNGRFYARGLYNPASKIRVRILTFDDEPITEAVLEGTTRAGRQAASEDRHRHQCVSPHLWRSGSIAGLDCGSI